MSFTDIKTKSQGFTIVELLIVVVVIAILAAITIVSYTGITNRANQSASKAAATTVQKKAELYYSEVGNYPVSKANFNGDSSKSYYLAGGFGSIAPTADAPSSGTNTKGTQYVQLFPCFATGTTASTAPTASNITGMRIIYWTYGDDGATAAAKTFTDLGKCDVVGTSTTAYN